MQLNKEIICIKRHVKQQTLRTGRTIVALEIGLIAWLKGQRVLIIGGYWKKTRMIAKCFKKPLKRSYLLRAK